LQQEAGDVPASAAEPDEALLRSVLAAYPDRVVRRRENDASRGVMVGGKGVRLAPSSGVTDAELFVAVDVDASGGEVWVRQASAVQRDWLATTSAIDVFFDPETEKVQARRRIRFDDLVLDDSPAALPDGEVVARVLADAARANLAKVLPPDDSAAGSFLLRVRCLRDWIPELNLPAFDDDALRDALPWVCGGARSFADVRRADWLGVLQGRLTPHQLQAVEREAPERIAVPSGSRVTLKYEVGRPPVLAVRIQELFGLADTPRVAGGRVRVLLYLLAPNYRPQQVTEDLASFWANTYPQVRRELRARYPRHAWPEDPSTAAPERRPQRRRSEVGTIS
jgi:ATP-dependent helicase HrpB